ncbi:MAG: phospholipase D-like domain-containing protein [Candidatus Eremiobacteraeota bacterium]|nr:phospholipase D-like domain-containing protein [Candidatus Eremiobacteraeota bacterium]
MDLLDSVASPEPPLHVKAAIVDGVVFLNDRNWAAAGAGTILRDDSHADVRALRDSIESRGTHSTRRLATDKHSALAREAAVLGSARRSVDVCSESFGSDNPVYLTLRALAACGVRCRVAVNRVELNPRERRAIASLQSCGVEVRVDEKFCVADAGHVWIGSANATSTYCNATQREWAGTTRASSIAVTVRARFSTYWAVAKNPPITG